MWISFSLSVLQVEIVRVATRLAYDGILTFRPSLRTEYCVYPKFHLLSLRAPDFLEVNNFRPCSTRPAAHFPEHPVNVDNPYLWCSHRQPLCAVSQLSLGDSSWRRGTPDRIYSAQSLLNQPLYCASRSAL